MFQNRLQKVQRHLGKQARRQGIRCYRLYDQDIPEFPFTIEWYDDKLYIAEYQRHHGLSEEAHAGWLKQSLDTIAATLAVSTAQLYLKVRQRKAGRQGQYRKLDESGTGFEVEENGLHFWVNLNDYLDTGLFLDHRITREMVRQQCEGKHMLNLFAYTGSFSVYAASGAAAEVTTIDLSNTYLDWARKNMQLNGFTDESRYHFVQADVLQWLDEAGAPAYDLIVMDPPTFSNSQRMKDILDIQRDHVRLIQQCLQRLLPGGLLYFSTNLRNFSLQFPETHGIEWKDITKQTTPFDFEGKLFRKCFLFQKR